jgi:plastocyanin
MVLLKAPDGADDDRDVPNRVRPVRVTLAMRKLLASLVVLAVLGVVAAQALAAARSVRVGDNFFLRRGHHTISVRHGSRVTFHWVGRRSHNVDARRGPVHFRSAVMTNGSFTTTLRRRGRYLVVCDIHPKTMRLSIRVR